MSVKALEVNEEVPRWEIVTERLLHKETKIKQKDIHSTETKAMTTHHISQQRREPPKCFQCGKYGHLKRYCRDFRGPEERKETPSKRKYNRKRNSCNMTNSKGNSSKIANDGHIGQVMSNALFTSKKETKWIVDSGATCHMCNDAEKFMVFESFDVAQEITLGDGYSVEALGKGTIEMSLKLPNKNHRECYLYESLCVPEFSFNLLSVY